MGLEVAKIPWLGLLPDEKAVVVVRAGHQARGSQLADKVYRPCILNTTICYDPL